MTLKLFFLLPLIVHAVPFVGGPAPLHCPPRFQPLYETVVQGLQLWNEYRYKESKILLTNAIDEYATKDPNQGMQCALGLSSAYRVLALNYIANPRTNNRRSYQIGLRILHQAMNWITHVFVKSGHDDEMIDGSAWPTTVRELNEDLSICQSILVEGDGLNQEKINKGELIIDKRLTIENPWTARKRNLAVGLVQEPRITYYTIQNGHQIHDKIKRLGIEEMLSEHQSQSQFTQGIYKPGISVETIVPLEYQPLVDDPENAQVTYPGLIKMESMTRLDFYHSKSQSQQNQQSQDKLDSDSSLPSSISSRYSVFPGRQRRHKIAIVSLCAYPREHVLPGYAISNHKQYAKKHGYSYCVETDKVDKQSKRPHAWGKIKLLERYLDKESSDDRSVCGDSEWIMWMDCDTYYMNMNTTIESVLYRYAGIPDPSYSNTQQSQSNKLKDESDQGVITSPKNLILDPEVHLLIAEDNAMLNSGTFFIRNSQWSLDLMREVYGPAHLGEMAKKVSPWVDHPWWENAALTWRFLKDVPRRFMEDDEEVLESWPRLPRGTGAENLVPNANQLYEQQLKEQLQGDSNQRVTPFFHELSDSEKRHYMYKEMEHIYPREVRICAQQVFNSYHPATASEKHDTWEPGKYVMAFNGVLSSTSPTSIRMLYGDYYRRACEINGIPFENREEFKDKKRYFDRWNNEGHSVNEGSNSYDNTITYCVPIEETLPWMRGEGDYDSWWKEESRRIDEGDRKKKAEEEEEREELERMRRGEL